MQLIGRSGLFTAAYPAREVLGQAVIVTVMGPRILARIRMG